MVIFIGLVVVVGLVGLVVVGLVGLVVVVVVAVVVVVVVSTKRFWLVLSIVYLGDSKTSDSNFGR